MLNYSIGEFFGILLTFGIMVFFSLIAFRGIFMVMSEFLAKKNTIEHHHFHHKDRGNKL